MKGLSKGRYDETYAGEDAKIYEPTNESTVFVASANSLASLHKSADSGALGCIHKIWISGTKI